MAIPRNLANIAPHVNASSTELVVNDGGANLDFRVEGDTNANAFFVDAGNNRVGVSTNAPGGRLDISYGAGSNVPGILIGADTGAFDNTTRTDATGKFGTIGGVPFTNSDGFYNVIGANSSSGVNAVNIGGSTGGLKGATQIIFATAADTTSTGSERARITSDGEFYVAGTSDQGPYNIQCNGTGVWGAGAYVNGSDERIKEDIAPIVSGLNVVEKLNPVTYRYKKDWSKDQNIQTGFIAQELLVALEGQNYIGGVVQQGGSNGYYNVAYQNIIPILTKAIQELKAELDIVKAELATLKG